MRICIVTEYFPGSQDLDIRGGAEACAFNEALELSKNHEVTVLTSRTPENQEDYKLGNIAVICCGPIRPYVQSGSFINRLRFMLSAYTRGSKLEIDAVIGYNFITHPVAFWIAKKTGASSIARYHDVWLGEWIGNIGFAGIIGELLERYTLSQKFDLLIAVSQYTARKIRRFAPSQRVSVVHNIVEFDAPACDKSENPSITCVSRLVEYKRIQDLIMAVDDLIDDFPELKCRIIGTGPLEGKLKALAHEKGLGESVIFSGFVEKHEDVLGAIAESWVFCLPSVVEGFGIVIVEAMGCGTPFVAAEIPPVVEASGGRGGLFFRPRDWKELSEKLRRLLTDEELYAKLRSEGMDQYRKYSAEIIGRQLEINIEKAMDSRV